MSQKYQYSELANRQIRILRLEPELRDGSLRGRLQHVDLEDAKGTFVAVSWTWGEAPRAEDLRMIILDGKTFTIRPNLWELLNTFRSHAKSLDFWIDAICINQDESNPLEKNHQIPMMAEIYQTAKEVYVWLGPSDDDSDHVMEALRGGTDFFYPTSRFVRSLLRLFKRPWWTRTWILQEYVLNHKSPRMFCGSSFDLSADVILEVWTSTATRAMVPHVAIEEQDTEYIRELAQSGHISRMYYLRCSRHNLQDVYLQPDLRNALVWLKPTKVTESRDKIYGALGLIEAQSRAQFVQMFGVHSNETAGRVYRDAAVYLLKCEKTSTTLYDFPIGRYSGLDAPSWVPNFSSENMSAGRSRIRLGDLTASHLGIPRRDVSFSEDLTTLFVDGLLLDTVNDNIAVFHGSVPGWDRFIDLDPDFQLPYLLHLIHDLINRNRDRTLLLSSSIEPLWKTLTAGYCYPLDPGEVRDEPGCHRVFDELMAIKLPDVSELLPASTQDEHRKLMRSLPTNHPYRRYCNQVYKNNNRKPHVTNTIGMTLAVGRTFFMGESGYYGISEEGTRNRDVVVLLFPDHFVPFILRRRNTSSGDNEYEMVAIAYIPGPQRDAAIAEYKTGKRELTKFAVV